MPAIPIRRSRLTLYGAAVLGYLFLASLAFQSIVFNLSTAIPGMKDGNPDFALFYWDLWWWQYAILHVGPDPFYTNYILFPHALNLAYHTLVPFLGLLAIPLSAATSWPVTVNILLIGSLVFNGVALFAFLRHHAVPNGLAFLGGALYAFNSFSTLHISVLHLNMIPVGWLPAGLLASDWLVERPSWKSATLLGLVIYAAVMTDQLFAVWLPLLLLTYFFYRLVRIQASARKRIVAMSAVTVVLLLVLLFIAPLPQWLAGHNVSYPLASLRTTQVRSLQLSDIISLPPRFADSERATLGLLLPIGVIAGLIWGRGIRDRAFWLMMGLVGLILALGPTLQPFDFPLPYQIVHQALGGLFRIPARFVILAILSLIIAAAFSLAPLYARLSRAGRGLFILSVLMFLAIENQWYSPFPVFNMPDYRIYHRIGEDPAEYLVLEVPVGPDNAIADRFGHGVELEYYAPIHHKRLINGAVSRGATGITGAYRQWPLITALAEEGPIPEWTAARDEFEMLSHDWDIRYVILHREMLSSEIANWAVAFFNSQPNWCLVDEEGPLLAYRRNDAGACLASQLNPPADGTIHPGDASSDRYLGPGWYPAENVGGQQARWTGAQPMALLQVQLSPQAYQLALHAASFLPDQTVTVSVNGQQIAELPMGVDWAEYHVEVPASFIPTAGRLTIALAASRSASAYERTNGQSEDRRPLAVAYEAITFTPVTPGP
jgi:hypothetical protein